MAGLFDLLPFHEAIEALSNRLQIRKDEFLELDQAARSRAFTMAHVSDKGLLGSIHDELVIAANNGETFNDFRKRLEEVKERTGWTGTSPSHYRLVYDQNLGMAYSAGRVEQGTKSGLNAWKYLPSISAEPRAEHEQYYGRIYAMRPGTPVPPIDFGCNCGWEWVFPEELEAMGVADDSQLDTFDPPTPRSGFTWSPMDYVGKSLNKVTDAASSEVARWTEIAAAAAGKIGDAKFDRVIDHLEKLSATMGLDGLARAIELIPPDIADEDEQELNRVVTLAGQLAGRVATLKDVNKMSTTTFKSARFMIQAPSAGLSLLVPWGDLQTVDDRPYLLMVDEKAAEVITAKFSERGTDLVIDYDHQSEPGVGPAPDGTARAAGWVKQGSLVTRPGVGIFGKVEWTERAAKMIADKEYKYLSPAIEFAESSLSIMGVSSIGLTNQPALKGAPMAVLYKQRAFVKGDDVSTATFAATVRTGMGKTPAEMNDQQAVAAGEEILRELFAVAGAQGVSAGSIAEALKTNKALLSKYDEMGKELFTLRNKVVTTEADLLIASDMGKVPPAQRDWFVGYYTRDPEAAKKWLRESPVLINMFKMVPIKEDKFDPNEFGSFDRGACITSARFRFKKLADEGHRIMCSERAYVGAYLADNGHATLTKKEMLKLGIRENG